MNINEFKNTVEYKNFIMNNPGNGNLKIRAYSASEALPVVGLNIVVSSLIGNTRVIFFNGKTDASGMIETINLPAPSLLDNLEVPKTIKYDIDASMGNTRSNFTINMYDGVCVVQNINFIPGEDNGN